VLGSLLIYISYSGYMHQQHETKFPSVDAICPFGGLESLYSLVTNGEYVDRVLASSVVLLVLITGLTIISGRSFCGWICPLGTLQGIMHGIGRAVLRKRRPVTIPNESKIRLTRYIVFIVFTVGAWYGSKLLIRPYDPWVAWMHMSEFEHAVEEFIIGIIILFVVLIISIGISRVFCRYMCPVAAFLSLVSFLSISRIYRDEDRCTKCSLCDKRCPVGLEVSNTQNVSRQECISCGECISACPVPDTLNFKVAGRQVLSSMSIGILVVALFFGTILVTQATGVYSSTPPSMEEYKASGDLKPEDIKGYMTLADVAYLFDLDLAVLYEQLDLDSTIVPDDTKCKEISDIVDRKFDTDIVRIGVGALLEIPAEEISTSCSPDESSSTGFIYGTMTLREVSAQFDIPIETLYDRLELDVNLVPPDTQCRDLKTIVSPDFHTSKVREVVDSILSGK